MKCEVCLGLLEEYLDGELAPDDQEQINAHLITCGECSGLFGTLTAEQELFARYDREIEVPAFMWTRVAAQSVAKTPQASWRTRLAGLLAIHSASFAGAIAILLLAIAVGVVYLITRQPPAETTLANAPAEKQRDLNPQQNPKPVETQPAPKSEIVAFKPRPQRRVKAAGNTLDQSDVLSSDSGYIDVDDQDTAKHIERTQNLLRSIRNFPVPDSDEDIDISYEKALSRRLLNENVVLRRDAEMKAKFPTKTLLADLEPFLIDIANLPDRARPEDLRVVKERVQKTEIVAALVDYQDRGRNNR